MKHQNKINQFHVFYSTVQTSGENSTVNEINEILSTKFRTRIFSVGFSSDRSFKSMLKHILASFKLLISFVVHSKNSMNIIHNNIPFLPNWILFLISNWSTVIKVHHNYRVICIKGSYFRSNELCFKCDTSKLNSVKYSCYRDSRTQTLLALIINSGWRKLTKRSNFYNVAISRQIENWLENSFNEINVKYIPNSYVESEILSSEGNDVLFLGRLDAEKGVYDLLKVWDKFILSFPDSKLHIIGDGKLKEDFIDKFGGSSIIFYGHQNFDDVRRVAKTCKIGVIPNKWIEPFGKVALDYLNLGLNIVATKSGGIVEILNQDPHSFFVDPQDPVSLIENMHSAMLFQRRPPELAMKQMSEFRRSHVSKLWLDYITAIQNSDGVKHE